MRRILAGTIVVWAALAGGADAATVTSETRTLVRAGPVGADGGEGNDVLSVKSGELTGGPGDDRLTGDRVDGGAGADVLQGKTLSYADRTAGVTVDLAAGVAGQPGENDQVLAGAEWIEGGLGPDVIRAGSTRVFVEAGAGDDVVDGSPHFDSIDGGPGADVLRGHGGGDDLLSGHGGESNHLEGGAGNDFLRGDDGADTLDGGSGRDRVLGEGGADLVRLRDGQRDTVECTAEARRLEGDRATLDAHDVDEWCEHVARTGRPRLELHGLVREGPRGLRLVVSCPRAARAACTGRARVLGRGSRPYVDAARRVHVPPGRRVRLAVRLDRRVRTRAYEFSTEVVIGSGRILRSFLARARR